MLEKHEYVSETEHTTFYKRWTRKSVNEEWQHDSTYGFFWIPKPVIPKEQIVYSEQDKKYIKVLFNFLINVVWPQYEKAGWTLEEVSLYREDLSFTVSDICQSVSLELLDNRQARAIFEACWDMPYLTPVDFICKNIDMFTKKDMTPIINQIISENENIIQQIKSGNTKAIGSLIGKAMKLDKSISPKEFSDKLMETINA